MIVEVRHCHRCDSSNIVKNGKNRSGTQTYKCKDCGCCRVLDSKQPGRTLDPDLVKRTYEERQSLRGTGRLLNVSHRTVLTWLKKKAQQLPDFKSTIEGGRSDDKLEADEMFTFIGMKINQIRVWIVQCRRNRQILSFFIGDGSMESCKRLWRKLPYEYLKCHSFSDFWKAYNCLPKDTHSKVGKETGLTNHVERLNNTLRQRISRFVRKALSFSKKEYMLNLHFKFFAYHYNLNVIS
jgi:insertion element IS1 protein InsB